MLSSLVCFAAGGLWLCCWGDVWIAGSVSSPGSLSPLVLLPSHHRGEKHLLYNSKFSWHNIFVNFVINLKNFIRELKIMSWPT